MNEELTKRINKEELKTCIINVSRKEGVEAIKINKKLEEILKPHQLEGLRFLWQQLVDIEKDYLKGLLIF
jgi:hypothetical protein